MDLRLELGRTVKLVVASPKGDLVYVAFLSRHSRVGLWILPSLPGLVCGNDLWPDGLELCWKRIETAHPAGLTTNGTARSRDAKSLRRARSGNAPWPERLGNRTLGAHAGFAARGCRASQSDLFNAEFAANFKIDFFHIFPATNLSRKPVPEGTEESRARHGSAGKGKQRKPSPLRGRHNQLDGWPQFQSQIHACWQEYATTTSCEVRNA